MTLLISQNYPMYAKKTERRTNNNMLMLYMKNALESSSTTISVAIRYFMAFFLGEYFIGISFFFAVRWNVVERSNIRFRVRFFRKMHSMLLIGMEVTFLLIYCTRHSFFFTFSFCGYISQS